MIDLFVDFETFSELSVSDTGAAKYAKQPSTEVLCFAYAFDDDPVELWIPGERFPITKERLRECIVHAHNAAFEYYIWNYVCVSKYDWPRLSLEQLECTAARCAALGLPRSLDDAAKALNLKELKDKEGHRKMQQVSKPKKPSKKDPSTRYTDSERFHAVFDYCIQDVVVEREIFKNTPPLSADEKEVWRLDFQINDIGVKIDRESCLRAIQLDEQEKERLNTELSKFTPFESAKQPGLAEWFVSRGVNLPPTKKGRPSMSAEAVTLALDEDHDDDVLRALEIRQQVARSSTAKFAAMVKHADLDDRVRGLHLYHGGHTGRFASRLFQSQNMPGGWKTAGEQYRNLRILHHKRAALKIKRQNYDSCAEFLKQCIRSMIMCEPGNRLIVCDYIGIENCVAAWLANEKWLLRAIREKQPIYEMMASRIYDKQVPDVEKSERQVGKIAELGLGYGMGAAKFQFTCEKYGVEVDLEFADHVKHAYRDSHPRIVDAWHHLEHKAVQAIKEPKTAFHCYKGRLRVWCADNYLWIKLPSGRRLAYRDPHLVERVTPWGSTKFEIRYWGVDAETTRWVRLKTFGAKLFENVVQAVARDILVHGMFNVDNAGYEIVLHVHDEIVSEHPIGQGSLEEFSELMCDIPSWAHGCPIRADGFETIRYRKAG